MNTKISMHRIWFILYVIFMILLTWLPNINQIVILLSLWIWVILYFSKDFLFTYKIYIKISFLYWLFFGILTWMPMWEEPSDKVYIWEIIVYGIFIIIFLGILFINIKSNRKSSD
jgi:hypothetical protein